MMILPKYKFWVQKQQKIAGFVPRKEAKTKMFAGRVHTKMSCFF